MTWKEFKDYVDSQMNVDDAEIWYIDISFPVEEHPPDVHLGDDGQLVITDSV